LDKILPSYHDPLFSILIITLLVLVVAIVSGIVGNYKDEKKQKRLKKFLGQMSLEECTLEIEKLPFEEALIKPLFYLARTFSIQGEYQNAINIYLYLINNIEPFFEKEHLLEGLGETYLRAGFLKRAENIFLEILHKRARNIDVLYNLEVVYELLHEYDKAKEILKPLEVLGENTKFLSAYLDFISFLKDKNIKKENKIEKLKLFLENNNYPHREIIKELFRLDIDSAWRAIDDTKINSIIDILWFLPLSNINFDIISANKTLKSIFYARGVLANLEDVPLSGIFAIDTINFARKGGSSDVDLSFSYGCSRCKQHFPISFDRCPNCYAIDSIQIKETIIKKESYRGYSLL
jgi:tetratricopeptide (TPR) repeat protein